MSHNDIWQAVDRLAVQKGLSASGLAKKAGLDATTFNKSKRILADGRLRWPSTESIMQILAATETNWDEFVALMGDAQNRAGETGQVPHERHLPFLQMNNIHYPSAFLHNGKIDSTHSVQTEEISFPGLGGDVCFIVEVNGSAYTPLYREGDRLLISPDAPLRRGDRVLVLPSKGSAILAEFIRKTNATLDLKAFTASKDGFSLSHEEVRLIGRIMWVSQ